MPPTFKALASIASWVLFIVGCMGILLPFLDRVFMGLYTGNPLGILTSVLSMQTGIFSLALSVAVMKLRKLLE